MPPLSTNSAFLHQQSLKLRQRSGNLMLIDYKNRTKWQSFDFPTDTLLWSQELNASTCLTAPPPSSSVIYYSLQIHSDRLSLYLNFKDQKYSYWEQRPLANRSISFVRLGSRGLKLFNQNYRKIGQILATGEEAVRYLSLGRTGNLQLYYASNSYDNRIVFESSYRAIDDFCSLPAPCGLFGICTRFASSACQYMQMPQENYHGFCNGSYNGEMQMVELEGIDTVLRTTSSTTNSTKDKCTSSCIENCSCSAARYTKQGCSHFALVAGAKEVGIGAESSYWIKVLKGTRGNGNYSGLTKNILLLSEILNVVIICCILGGAVYCIIKIRKRMREVRN